MNWADWAIIAIVALSALISLVRGFVREALSLAVWVAAVIIAANFYQSLASQFTNLIETPSLQLIVAWVVLFLATLLVGMLVTYVIGQLVKATGLSGTDRLIGSLFGIARGLVLVLIVLVLVPKALPVDEDPWWQQSRLIPQFLKFEQWAAEMGGSLYESGKQLLSPDLNPNPEQQTQTSFPGS
ncbi:CvpA family protein [Porticoccus sp. W117]|uniref:CvpA family protein n=1 Tax=Porticoccus sp. W117 TaxID=3054777 RepID=UPI0025948A76|nr:CvpA family protein [Porticoccus sp. W117]MDM3871674.1 CvpA family protein [Porticoccus sp. W117]